jgi:hypothetical protein
MKATILMLLGMGLASIGAGCAVDVNAEDQEATQEEPAVGSSAQAVCRKVCREVCEGRGRLRRCRSVCKSVCYP